MPPGRGRRGGAFAVLLGAILAAAAGVRIAGAYNELWLDEIWSLSAARGLPSALAAFTALHHEINHYLNTIWLHLTGASGQEFVCRGVALAAGILSVGVAAAIGARRSRPAAVVMALVAGFSYPLVLYSSEARGYATAVFAALAGYYCLGRFLAERRWGFAAAFAACGILGLASHLMFVSFLAAAGAATLVRFLERDWTLREMLGAVVIAHGAPGVFLGWLYVVDIRHLVAGGGTTAVSLIDVYGSAIGWAVGGVSGNAWKIVPCLVAAAVIATGLRRTWAERRHDAVFLALIIIVVPVGLALGRGSDALYYRHFLLSVVFAALLLADGLAGLFAGGKAARAAGAAGLLAYLAVNLWQIGALVRLGRGDFQGTMRYIDAQSPGGQTVRVAGDHEFRIALVLQYYGARLQLSKPITYFKDEHWPQDGVEFVIANRDSSELVGPPVQRLEDRFRHQYELARTAASAPLSGITWYVYRRVPGT